MQSFFAALPILIVLGVMILLHWSGPRAGLAGWLSGIIIAALAFGLTPEVFWISQLKGLFLSLTPIMLVWPALFLYKLVDQIGGIRAVALALEGLIPDRGLLLVVLAWAFSGMLEGLAGFGLPIAIVAPLLIGLEVEPLVAITAVAIGHCWAVTFGGMGAIFQTLVAVVKLDGLVIAPLSALLLGIACLGCGLSTALILKQGRLWPKILLLALVIGSTQYGMAVVGLSAPAAFTAGLGGVLASILICKVRGVSGQVSPAPEAPARPALAGALLSYGAVVILLILFNLLQPLNQVLKQITWQAGFPTTITLSGFTTPTTTQVFRYLLNPGPALLLVALSCCWLFPRVININPDTGGWRKAWRATLQAAVPATIGVELMICLASLMEYSGMTRLLAETMAYGMGVFFPIVSPLVGILGAFATGSNNNSNVLFAPLQQNVALLLKINPLLLIATQTTGGALGSMISPAKIIIGASTVNLKGHSGDILKRTLPYAIALGLGVGLIAFVIARF